MHLPVAERGAVILKDVLGYSLEEIYVMHATVPATKAALHRGRRHLRELAEAPEENSVPVLAGPERSLLAAYVDRLKTTTLTRFGRCLQRKSSLRSSTGSDCRGVAR